MRLDEHHDSTHWLRANYIRTDDDDGDDDGGTENTVVFYNIYTMVM